MKSLYLKLLYFGIMKKYVFIFTLLSLFGCIKTNSSYVAVLSPDAYEAKLSARSLIIDVRTPEEFAAGHLENAININFFDTDFEDQISDYKTNKKVFIYCKSGRRSGLAATKMTGLGFGRVINLKGGILAWEQDGKPIITN